MRGEMAYQRYYPWTAPKGWTFYHVRGGIGEFIGDVAHDGKGHWWADNKRWNFERDASTATIGGQLTQSFRSRSDAAEALWHIFAGTASPELYGGYAEGL